MENLVDSITTNYIESIKNTEPKIFFIIENKEEIKKMLREKNTLSEHIVYFKKEKKSFKISNSTYIKHLKFYFKKDFNSFMDRVSFLRYRYICFSYIYTNKIRDLTIAYDELVKKNYLRHSIKGKSFCSKEYFIENMKKYIKESIKGDFLVKKESMTENKEIEVSNKKKKDAKHKKLADLQNENKHENRNMSRKNEVIDIELVNSEMKKCTLSYLKADYIADSSGLILEKNIYSFKNNYNDISINMEKLEDILNNNNPFIANYSLVVYVDEGKSNYAFIYRLIDKEFVLLDKLSAYDFVVEMEDVKKVATERFYSNIITLS